MKTHTIKCDPEPFEAIVSGVKRFEWCRYDRDYRVHDTLRFLEHEDNSITGRWVACEVTYILYGPEYGIPEGFCVMSILRRSEKKDDVA